MYCIGVLFHTMITLTFKSYTDNTVCRMYFHSVANTHIWHFSNDCAVEAKINVFISILSDLILIKIVLSALSSMNFIKKYMLSPSLFCSLLLSVRVINRLVLYCKNDELKGTFTNAMYRKSIWLIY